MKNEIKKCWNCGGNCQGIEACMPQEESEIEEIMEQARVSYFEAKEAHETGYRAIQR